MRHFYLIVVFVINRRHHRPIHASLYALLISSLPPGYFCLFRPQLALSHVVNPVSARLPS